MDLLFIDTLEMALPISILIGILLLISPLIKKSFVAKWRYFMWMFVAVRLILPLKIDLLSAPITMELPQNVQGIPVALETAHETASMSLQTILMLIWFLGIAVFTAYQAVSYFSFKRTVKRWAKPVENEQIINLFNQIKQSVCERRKLDFKLCKAVSTPMVFGFIKPTLLLPQDDYTQEELSVILRHELIHFKRNDIWYKLILVVANAMNWFNPLVYLMTSAANKDIELACDAEVVREQDMDFRRNYCHAILTVVHNKKSLTTPLSTCFIISKSVIKERFGDILDIRKKRKGIGLFIVVALSVAISGSMVTFATEKAADVLEEDLNIVERPTPKPKEEPIPESVSTETNDYTETNYSEPKSVAEYTESEPQYDEPKYEEPQYDGLADAAVEETVPEEETFVTEVDEQVGIGEERDSVYEQLGEPDSVSEDGSKEVYSLDNGSTAILQYENDVLEEGYILVD